MAQDAARSTGAVAIPKPPSFLKTKRARDTWRYLVTSLDAAKLDYRSAYMQLALLADKTDSWRQHFDAVVRYDTRYDHDANGGSLETDESRAERRARAEVIKDLDEAGLTVLSCARVRMVDRISQGDLFSNPFDALPHLAEGLNVLPSAPPWTMRPAEKRIWKDLLPLLERSGFDFSTSGLSIGLLCAAISDWIDCKRWIEDNRGLVFAVAADTGRTYEVSASYNRAKIAKQIRELLKRNGMTVYSCAKNKAISRGRIVSEELAEILGFIEARPD